MSLQCCVVEQYCVLNQVYLIIFSNKVSHYYIYKFINYYSKSAPVYLHAGMPSVLLDMQAEMYIVYSTD